MRHTESGARNILVATRHYHDVHPTTRVAYELQDRMVRKPCGSFALFKAGNLPGDPEVEEPFSLQEVFAWFGDLPGQIKRAVI